eukprot:CAMPEP_0178413414 /NCGR_PEP_ID=MMETSP0689_2-20121128/22515_1 /TAXON_ID=160604 /ORGANISM="Amphidinium massartii, Strain CS-259" /LENGTH=53 /DNA_ID=CAMNT_0020034685 /DNA_START=659 /DNA_END=820 /DNA_ORIENTATION=+
MKAEVCSVEDVAEEALEQEHHRSWHMVCIDKCDLQWQVSIGPHRQTVGHTNFQ